MILHAPRRCSVALCTYRGERYLRAQLESMARQTRLPDELVVCDDVSGDNTPGIVERFAETAPFPVRLFVNEVNLRSTKNFAKAFSLCQGDWIVPSDQDDVWREDKLEKLEGALYAAPDVALAFSNADCVDEHLRPLAYTLWDAIDFNVKRQAEVQTRGLFSMLLSRYVVTGAAMAFKSHYLKLALPIPDAWVHDAWLAFILSAVAESAVLDESLILYRQHSAQQIGAKKPTLLHYALGAAAADARYFKRQARMYVQALVRLTKQKEFAIRPERVRMLEEKVRHQCMRYKMRYWRVPIRAPRVLREWREGNYERFAPHWLAVLQDLVG